MNSVLSSDNCCEMKFFKYPVEVLVKAVKERPMIWDKTLEAYKDKEERKHAWDEIYKILEDGYNEMSRENKRITADIITNKWTNIRDTFIKSLKTQSMNKSKTRKYLYHDEMSFLLKVLPQEIIPNSNEYLSETEDDPISYDFLPNMKQETTQDASEGDASTSSQKEKETKRSKKNQKSSAKNLESSPERETPRRKKTKKSDTQKLEPVDSPSMDFVALNEVNDPRVMNEDEAFFASLLPTVVKYSEEERLDFRIEVLAVMRNISEKRRFRWTGEAVD